MPFSEYIAQLCGIWNGLVDFVGGIIQFIGAILSAPADIALDLDTSLEVFDSFCVAVKKFKFATFWNAIKQGWEKGKAYFKESGGELNTDKVAYAFGYAEAFIATFFIPFTQLTKVANLSKIGKAGLPANMMEQMSNSLSRGATIVTDAGKVAVDGGLKVVRAMIALLGKGGEELKAFFEKIWKAIADWFLKNKKVFVDWTKEIQKAFGSDSKSDGLFRDIFKKFVVNNKGALTQRQFLKIAKQIEKHFSTVLD
jgi:hypothetical protein